MQIDGLIRTKHLAGSNAESERVADLASGAGDGDIDGTLHVIRISKRRGCTQRNGRGF
jgi:hypothetical protein